MNPKQIIIDAVLVILGVVLGAWWARRVDRAKMEINDVEAASKACKRLLIVLSDWYNKIVDVVNKEDSVPKTLQRLKELLTHEHFKQRIESERFDLEKEPLCRDLLNKTDAFNEQAFESKGKLAMALTPGKFSRDYRLHKTEAIQALQGALEDFENELKRVIPQLDEKKKRLL